MDHHSRHAYIDKPRFYNTAGQSQGGLVGQNKILKLPPLGNTLCCFYVSSFFMMALERIIQPPSILSSDFRRLPGAFSSALDCLQCKAETVCKCSSSDGTNLHRKGAGSLPLYFYHKAAEGRVSHLASFP